MTELIKLSLTAIDKVKLHQDSNLLLILSTRETNQQRLDTPNKERNPQISHRIATPLQLEAKRNQ